MSDKETKDYLFINGCDGTELPHDPNDPTFDWIWNSSLTEEEARQRVLELAEKLPGFLVAAVPFEIAFKACIPKTRLVVDNEPLDVLHAKSGSEARN